MHEIKHDPSFITWHVDCTQLILCFVLYIFKWISNYTRFCKAIVSFLKSLLFHRQFCIKILAFYHCPFWSIYFWKVKRKKYNLKPIENHFYLNHLTINRSIIWVNIKKIWWHSWLHSFEINGMRGKWIVVVLLSANNDKKIEWEKLHGKCSSLSLKWKDATDCTII